VSFLVSPGVKVTEIDLTTIIPAVSTTETAMVGQFQWGPCQEIRYISGEEELVRTFFKPDTDTFVHWYSAWSFLAYGNQLLLVREVDTTNANTDLRAANATSANSQGFLVLNRNHYELNYDDGELYTNHSTGPWIAKYPGDIGNSIRVSVCASANAYQSTLTGSLTVSANTAAVSGVGTLFTTQVSTRDLLVLNDEIVQVKSVANNTRLTLTGRHIAGASSNTSVVRRWEHYVEVDRAPDTTPFAKVQNGKKDEMHVVIVDDDGRWTGSNNTVMEVWQSLSKSSDSKNDFGDSIYYKDVINQRSRYVWWAGHATTITNAGERVKNTGFGVPYKPLTYALAGGRDGTTIGNDERVRGWDMFADPEKVDVSILAITDGGQTVATYVINNIAEKRRDCVVVLSPPRVTAVNNADNEAVDIVTYRDRLPSTSYAMMDSGWKKIYDKYADVSRMIPLNSDVAGCMVYTDWLHDPWWSPAGFRRGRIKNIEELAWNPNQPDRDILYKNNVNPVMHAKNEGVVLFGDKTLLTHPSAFDRINVRRLFIVLEKAIAIAAKYLLFEFNDAFTRAQFKAMVEPFLRDVQGRRGIIDFRVICDETNNTGEVIDRNEFVGDIYIKPNRVINFINLRFVAVRTSVQFEEVIGKFG
jgi:phage tail sheath protein FI